MTVLTSEKRKHIRKSAFGIPSKRAFPMPDAVHARLAISGATRAFRAGHISASTEAHIKSMARAKLRG